MIGKLGPGKLTHTASRPHGAISCSDSDLVGAVPVGSSFKWVAEHVSATVTVWALPLNSDSNHVLQFMIRRASEDRPRETISAPSLTGRTVILVRELELANDSENYCCQ